MGSLWSLPAAMQLAAKQWKEISRKRRAVCLCSIAFLAFNVAVGTIRLALSEGSHEVFKDSSLRNVYFPRLNSFSPALDSSYGVIITSIPRGPLFEQLRHRSIIDTWLSTDHGIKVSHFNGCRHCF